MRPFLLQVLRMCEVPREWQNGHLSNLQEDPVRLLRGVRFIVQFDLTVDPRTLAHMQHCCSRLAKQGARGVSKKGSGLGAQGTWVHTQVSQQKRP